MKRLLKIALPSLLLVGCAGTQSYSATMAQRGELRMVEPDDRSHDYKFYIAAVRDIGMSTHESADRLMLIRAYLGDACKEPEVIADQFLKAGGSAIGGFPHGTYVIKVKCRK